MNDITIYENGNGGDLVLTNNDLQLDAGLYNNVYLCLFGGNIEATSDEEVLPGEENRDWWGNRLFYEQDPNQQFNSLFERALNTTALTSAGISELENIAMRDLQPLQTIGNVSVNITLTGNDSLEMRIVITELDTNIPQQFMLIWNQTRNQIILNQII